MNYQHFLESSRKLRSKLFEPIGKFLLELKLTANHLTFFSLILGVVAIYFLFQNHLLFIVFAALHLLADSFDGILARLTKPTVKGKYFDYLSDRTITLLLLVKILFYLHDQYIILVIILFILSQSIHLFSKFRYPIIFFRTGGLIFFSLSPLFSFNSFLTFGYLCAGILSMYSLLLQLKYAQKR
jgi:phosphatidylglycerophosphate synthase